MRKIILYGVLLSIGVLIIAFILAGIFFNPTGLAVLPEGTDVLVTRDLSNLKIGEEFEVILEVTIREELSALGIEEYVPATGNITTCSEENYRITDNKIEILSFDPNGTIKTKNVTYSVILNSDDRIFSGTWQSVSPDLSGFITNTFEFCGDGDCNDDETCSSCPTDCGSCPSNGGSSSGGGGGGGGSSSITGTSVGETIEEGSSDSENTGTFKEEDSKEFDQTKIVRKTDSGFFRNMGNTILGFFSDEEEISPIRIIIVTLIVIVIIFVIITFLIKKNR